MHLFAPLQFSLRALRAEARESGAMHVRWILPTLLIVVQAFFIRGFSFTTAPGLELLSLVVNTAVVFQLFSMSYYASGYTEEREAGVIELLLLTGGGRGSLALGILADRLVRPLVSLAVLLPLLALCVAMGGVDSRALVHGALQILTAMLLCHALGALISALMPSTFAAATASYLFWLGLLLAVPFLALGAELMRNGFGWHEAATFLHSVTRGLERGWESLFFAPRSLSANPGLALWPAKGLLCLIAWALSAWVFLVRPEGLAFFNRSSRTRTRAARSRPPAGQAVRWKQSRFSFPGRWFGWRYDICWIVLAVGLLVYPFRLGGERQGWAVVLAFSACIFSALRCTLESWTLVWPEIKAGTWDGLLGTPLSLRGVLAQKVRAALRHLPFELAAALVACLVFLNADGSGGRGQVVKFIFWFAAAGFGASVLLVVATFYFSLVLPLLAPGLACGAILGLMLVCAFAQSPIPFLFLAPAVAYAFWAAARLRLARDLPESPEPGMSGS